MSTCANYRLKIFDEKIEILNDYIISTMKIFCHIRCVIGIDQEALNTWRGRLQHFLQLLYNQKIQKVILI